MTATAIPPAQAALLARLHSQALQARFAPHDVTPAQYPVLQHLWEQDGLTQNELCGFIGIEQPTMANTLKRMERDGLVRKVPDDNDRRKVRIKLTKRAKDLAETLTGSAQEVLAVTTQGLIPEELALLERAMGRMIVNLEQDLAQDPLVLDETVQPDETVPPMKPAKPESPAAASRAPSIPAQANQPEPVQPEPVHASQTQAVAAKPEPAKPEPAKPDKAKPAKQPAQPELPLLRPVSRNEMDLLILDEEVVEPMRPPRTQIPLPLELGGDKAPASKAPSSKAAGGLPANEHELDHEDQGASGAPSAEDLEEYMLLDEVVEDVAEEMAPEDNDKDQGPDDPDQDLMVIRD